MSPIEEKRAYISSLIEALKNAKSGRDKRKLTEMIVSAKKELEMMGEKF